MSSGIVILWLCLLLILVIVILFVEWVLVRICWVCGERCSLCMFGRVFLFFFV